MEISNYPMTVTAVEPYQDLLLAAKEVLACVPTRASRALVRAIRRCEAPVFKMAIWRNEDGEQFPLVNIGTLCGGELAGVVLNNIGRTEATEIVTAWNSGNRRYAVSLLNATRDNQKRYAIKH